MCKKTNFSFNTTIFLAFTHCTPQPGLAAAHIRSVRSHIPFNGVSAPCASMIEAEQASLSLCRSQWDVEPALMLPCNSNSSTSSHSMTVPFVRAQPQAQLQHLFYYVFFLKFTIKLGTFPEAKKFGLLTEVKDLTLL